MFELAFWTIIPLTLCSITCTILGRWLVLTRQSMTGDAMSHSVLPGLVLVYLLAGTRAPLPMLFGAIAAALVTVWLTKFIAKAGVQEDASLGAVFTFFFAIGVVLLTRFASQVDLDPGCVLYGLAEFIPLDSTRIGNLEVPRALTVIAPLCLLSIVIAKVFDKELLLTAFDPGYAKTEGFKPEWVTAGLLSLISIAVVTAFELVGSILVIAMLVVPTLVANLTTTEFRKVKFRGFWISAVLPTAGYLMSLATNTNVAGMIATLSGALFLAVAVFVRFQSRNSLPDSNSQSAAV